MFNGDDDLLVNDVVDNECGNDFLLTLDEYFDTVTETLGSWWDDGNPDGAGNDDEHDGGDWSWLESNDLEIWWVVEESFSDALVNLFLEIKTFDSWPFFAMDFKLSSILEFSFTLWPLDPFLELLPLLSSHSLQYSILIMSWGGESNLVSMIIGLVFAMIVNGVIISDADWELAICEEYSMLIVESLWWGDGRGRKTDIFRRNKNRAIFDDVGAL